MSRTACAGFWNSFFGLEDDVVENLLIVLQAHCDRYACKMLNEIFVVKYLMIRVKKTVRP